MEIKWIMSSFWSTTEQRQHHCQKHHQDNRHHQQPQQNQWQHTDSFSIEILTDSLCSNFPYWNPCGKFSIEKFPYWNVYRNLLIESFSIEIFTKTSSERFSIEILAEVFAWKFFYWNQCRHVSVESCSIEILPETSLLKIFLLKSLQKRLFGRIFYWNPSKNLSYSNLCPESVSIEILTEIGSFYWNHYKNVSSERISIEILAEPFFWKLFRWNP